MEFLNECWGLWGLNKLLKSVQETATTALKSYRISYVFLFCDIHTQTVCYKKEICRLFANFLSCNVVIYHQNRSTFDRVIAAIKTVNFFETRCRNFRTEISPALNDADLVPRRTPIRCKTLFDLRNVIEIGFEFHTRRNRIEIGFAYIHVQPVLSTDNG